MNTKEVKVGSCYKLRIKTSMPWEEEDPEPLKNKWASFCLTDGEIIKVIGEDKKRFGIFKCEYIKVPNVYFCVSSWFFEELPDEETKCRCPIMITGCTCGIFQKEKNRE